MTERLMEDKTVNNVDNEENEIKLDPKRQSTIIKIFSIGFILLIISIIIFFLLRNQIKVLNDGKNINRPLIDNKEYIFYELTNKMKVALISDKKTKISGGSLTVKAGSFYDLIVGLAVYSSKMILAGSEKYGNDTDTFIDKIKEMEGVNIINTLNNMTIYSFHVYNEGFIKILDIFASILDKPKLAINNNNDTLKEELEKYMSSNVEAIDSEFYATNNSKYLLKQVFKDLAHKNHPYHNSTLGKIETLREKMDKTKDPNKKNNYTLLLLSDVKSYFDTFYKTKDMTLVLYSNLSLKEMKKELQSKFTFDAHSSLSSETFLFKQKFEQLKKEPYSKDNLNMFALYRSNNWNNIHFSFYFSQSNPNIKIALEYFKFIFFSRENKTLINTLMNNETFEYIIDESDIGYSNFNIFSFRLLLNRNSTNTIFINVINDVYSYIEKISQNINKDLYNNLKDIYEFNFKTQENTKDIAKLTSTLSNKLFSGDYNNFLKKIVFPEYSETIEKNIKDIISKMNKENSNIVLATYEETIFNAFNKTMSNKILDLHKLNYYYKSGIDNVLNDNKLLIKNNQYEIRKVNQNIPNITKSDLVKYSKSEYELNDSLHTFRLFNNNYYECYFATERQLEIPKVEFVFNFYSPNYYPCSLDNNTHLLSTLTMPFIIEGLLKQYFSEYFEVANSFELKRKLDFFYLKLILFNDTKNENYIKDLFQKIINKIFEHSNADKYLQRIGRAKFRQLLLEYSQTGIESVSKNTFEILKAIVSKLYIQPQTLLDQLLNVDSFEENFYSTFIQNIHLNVTIIGDIDRKKANNFSDIIKKKVMENHKEVTEPKKNFTIKNVSDGVVYYYYSINKSPSEKQNIISIFYQIGKNSFKKFVYTKLFNICIGDIFINSLRKLRVSNVKTDLVLFNDILYYQITAYANETTKISKIDNEISLSLNQSIHEEIDKFNKFEDEVKRIISDGKSLYRTNLYEVTEKVINRNEAPKDYNKEDGLLKNVTKKNIKDYFTIKFIEFPKRIGIIIFNKFYDEKERNNDLKEFINKTHVLNPNITNNVTDNFIINPIPSKNDYEYN